MKRLVLVTIASLAGLCVGCPGDAGPPPGIDSGVRLDAGDRPDGPLADGESPDPDGGGTTDPDGGTTDPDGGGTTDPDAGGTTDPDGGASGTDGGTTDPDGGAVGTDGGTIRVDGGFSRLDGGPLGCRTNADCPVAGTFCDKGSANCGGVGTCERRPAICPGVIDPVCGCDGNTYNNACEANRAGVNVAAGGACTGGGTCTLVPDPTSVGCCFDDGDCGREQCVGEVCRVGGEGTCHTPAPAGECWEDSDCPRGVSCVGAIVCPCGALCIIADRTGRCGTITPGP